MSLIPPFTVAPVDPKTGRWNRDWWLFLHSMWEQAGGTNDMADIEAVGLPRNRRGTAGEFPDVVPARSPRARKVDEAVPARHAQQRLLLTKETYKPLTMIRLYVGLVADIPAGWQLADGTNGTPNMKDLFVVGAGNLYGQGTTGGSTTITANNLPAHAHPYSDKDTTYAANTVAVQSGAGTTVVQSLSAGGGVTPSTTSNNTTTAAAFVPPYYAVAYIINTKTVTVVTDAKMR